MLAVSGATALGIVLLGGEVTAGRHHRLVHGVSAGHRLVHGVAAGHCRYRHLLPEIAAGRHRQPEM